MAKDPRLEKLRSMDTVIATFTARELANDPSVVNQRYLEHAATHMSLGGIANYVDALLKWTRTNKGAVVGAIAGEVGYGKTSTAIHLWQQCEDARVIAVPPFEWHRLQDIIDATWAWVRYRVEQIQPRAVQQIDHCYERYREKSVKEFADKEDIPVSKVQGLVKQGKVNLGCRPADVVEFLTETNRLLEDDALELYGPIVFTDELQVTMSRYLADHRSRDEFMQDVFELLNPLLNRQGSFGLMIGLPLNTETLINDVRPDILQRLQRCNLFIRPSSMYERDFPAELWSKFAEVYEFEEKAGDILPADTLDSIGQIAFRDDLGAGPRTVVEVMRCAIDHYDKTGQGFSPIDLIDAYLGRQVAFDSGGKLIEAVTEALQSKEVEQVPGGEQAIKLMAAFPMGCPDDRFKIYSLQDARDAISRKLYTEYMYKFPEGISLRKLAPTERGAEPRFIELTKEFIQTYSESRHDLQAAIQAFEDVVIREMLVPSRRSDQVEGWIPDAQVPEQYVGTFDRKYPERQLVIRVSTDRSKLLKKVQEFGLAFWFDPDCDYESCGRIERGNEAGTLAIYRLNLLRHSSKPLNIPYIEELGYPLSKVTPAFMLALVQHLHANDKLIPEDEKRMQIPPFRHSMVNYAIQLLFGQDLLESAEFDGLSKVGLASPQEVFSKMCQARYPAYETLITTGRWERTYTAYLNALKSQDVSSSIGVLRGNKPFEAPQRDVLTLFGESKVQTFKGLAENLSGVLDVDLGTKADVLSTVRFKLHPAEEAFMEALRTSTDRFTRKQVRLRALGEHEGFGLLRGLGYREDEIAFILQILKARRLVEFNQRQQRFEEVLESPDERREAILASMAELTARAEVLAQLPDFDTRFSTQAGKLAERVSGCEDIEKLEECQTELGQLREKLNQFSASWANKIQSSFTQIHEAAEQILRTSAPADLTRPLKSDVSWVSELVHCQTLLKEKYQRVSLAFRTVDSQAATAWNAWTSASPADPAAILALYEANRAAQTELREAQSGLDAARGYLQSYIAWPNVLNVASNAYREALGCETSYKQSQFRQELDTVFGEITDRFRQKQLEALPDHEMYSDRIKETQEQITAWLRDRRENYMQVKLTYEETLKAMGVGRFNLHAAFDTFDPETSRVNLYSEVLDKTRQHIQALEQELERYRTETLYAGQVAEADTSESSTHIRQAEDQLAQVKKQLHDDCVRQQECFTALGNAVKELSAAIQKADQSLRGTLQKREPSSEEEAILAMLQDPKGTDVRVVITGQIASEGKGFSLDKLMGLIVTLFKKNQVNIRIEKVR
ncbi:MAG: hypothetical protein JW850_23820 [Thermoflexales bacterium]|nr:hypothetical protein [Thermoflexales bacterium]